MTVVPDTSPLIFCSKIELIDLLPRLYGGVLITPRIWEEAVTAGKTVGARDASLLEKSAKELSFTRVTLTTSEKRFTERLKIGGTGSGEAEVLSVARNRKAVAILDDKEARATALGLGVDFIGTVGVLYEAFIREMVSYEKLLILLESLGRVAWVSPDLLASIIKRARDVRKE